MDRRSGLSSVRTEAPLLLVDLPGRRIAHDGVNRISGRTIDCEERVTV